MSPLWPRYEDGGLALISSISAYFGAPTGHRTLDWLDRKLAKGRWRNIVMLLYDGTTVTDGTAFVRHGLCLVVRTPAVHHGTAVTDGTAFVRHGLCFMSRSGFMHGLCPVSRCAFMNGRSCMVAGTLPLHRGFHLMAGGAFVRFPPDLLGLRRGPAAAVMTGCRCLGHTH